MKVALQIHNHVKAPNTNISVWFFNRKFNDRGDGFKLSDRNWTFSWRRCTISRYSYMWIRHKQLFSFTSSAPHTAINHVIISRDTQLADWWNLFGLCNPSLWKTWFVMEIIWARTSFSEDRLISMLVKRKRKESQEWENVLLLKTQWRI